MPLSSEIVQQTIQANGSVNVHERHTDHIGKTYDIVYNAPAGTDLNILLGIRAARLNESLKQSDLRRAVFEAPWDYTLVYATNADLAPYVRDLYRESIKDQTALVALRIIEWINNGRFTVAQLKTVFSLSTAEFDTLKAKMENIISSYQVVEGAVGE